MNGFRHSLLALAAAVAALLAMFFVATATLAATPPIHAAHGMEMSSEIPCESEAIICAPDCAVFCQALVAQPPIADQLVSHFGITYRVRPIVLDSLSVDAEDPPPR